MSLFPLMPAIPEAYLDWQRDLDWVLDDDGQRVRRFVGTIEIGMIVAWEPDIPTARTLVIVCQIDEVPNDERRIWTMSLDSRMRGNEKRWKSAMRHTARSFLDGAPSWNDESRFREAVVSTMFKPQNP